MTELGRWSVESDDFYEIVGTLASVSKAPREAVVAEVTFLVGEYGGLPRTHALRLAERSGWSSRHLWRIAAQAQAAQAAPPEPVGYFHERLEMGGPEAFVFDELALSLLYLCGGNRSRFVREVEDAGYEMPSMATVSRRWQEVPRAVRDGVTSGHRNRFNNTLYVRTKPADHANDVWQIDDFDLDLRVLVRDPEVTDPDLVTGEVDVKLEGTWKGRRPHLTMLIDDHSRFIVAWMLLDHHPTALDVKCLFGDACEARSAEVGDGIIGGVPDKVICDNASSFTAYVTEQMFTSLAVPMRPSPAYTPVLKGKIERAGQTVQEMLVTGLAGIVSKAERVDGGGLFDIAPEYWLEYEQLEALCAKVIHDYNYRRPHAALKRKTPASVYVASNVHPRVAPDEVLAETYQPLRHGGGERILQKTGVYALDEYWLHEDLDPHIGRRVSVRRLHHRVDRLAVYSEAGDFIAMAIPARMWDKRRAEDLTEHREWSRYQVNRYAARAREAMMLRTAEIAVGGDLSMVDAALEAFDARMARNAGPVTSSAAATKKPAGSAPTTKASSASKTSGTPKVAPASKSPAAKRPPAKPSAKAVSGKTPGGRQPSVPRGPRQKNSTAHLPPASSRSNVSNLDVAEAAALKAARRSAKGRHPSSGDAEQPAAGRARNTATEAS